MCVIVTVGIAGFRGDATAPFRAAGFTTEPAANPTACAMPRDAVRINVTAGGCSCNFYCGDTPEKTDPDADRRRYARKGWSQAKIERAIEASRSAHRPKSARSDLPAQFAAAIETLAKQGARVTLLAYMFSGSFDEPFSIAGTTELPLGYYVKPGNYFPEDTLVTIVA
jgi:hypothetical protein